MTYEEFVSLVGVTVGMSGRKSEVATGTEPVVGDVAWRLLIKLRPDIADPIRQGLTPLDPNYPMRDITAFWDAVRARWNRS